MTRKLFVFLLLAAGLTGCDAPDPDSRRRVAAQVRLDDAIAAEVNGSVILRSDVLREAEEQDLIEPGEPLDESQLTFDRVLEELIDQRLLALEAEARGVHRSEEAQRRLSVARERILGNILVESVLDTSVTEDAIRRMYEEQVRLVELGEEIRARHILVASRDEAQDLVAALTAGADFAALAFEHSLDAQTRLEGGDLGFTARNMLMAPFVEAAETAALGEVAGPFESEFGWHVIRIEERRRQSPPSFAEMRPRIIRFLTFDEIQALIDTLRDEAVIERRTGPGDADPEPSAPPEPADAEPAPETPGASNVTEDQL
ncbi:MAG: peptidylprolyl isomerase [Maricaulaceae bacterium]